MFCLTCVVDGDMLWYKGEKMRLKDTDTPETNGKCSNEREVAQLATLSLVSILSSGITSIERHGYDRYDRTLVHVHTNMGQAGELLLELKLADRYGDGQNTSWCR